MTRGERDGDSVGMVAHYLILINKRESGLGGVGVPFVLHYD
jgi:hypothetical protein